MSTGRVSEALDFGSLYDDKSMQIGGTTNPMSSPFRGIALHGLTTPRKPATDKEEEEEEEIDTPPSDNEDDVGQEEDVEVATVKVSAGPTSLNEAHTFDSHEFLYETPDSTFHVGRALKHFIINFIGSPIVFLAPGWSNYTAQGFGEFRTAGDFAYVLLNFSLPATVFISLAMYWAAPPSVYHLSLIHISEPTRPY